LISISFGMVVILLLAAFVALFQTKISSNLYSLLLLVFSLWLIAMTCCSGNPIEWHTHRWLAVGNLPITMRLDLLSGLFLGLLGMVGIAVSMFSPGYLNHLQSKINLGQYWCALLIFVLSMALVLLAADAVSFMVFWELMSLSSVALVASDHRQKSVQKAALIYLGATRVATAFLALGFICLHASSGSWMFADWHSRSTTQLLPAALVLLGFCIKAGVWPFHIWLPYAHPAAPSTVSSLMSGVMVKIALYGIIRVLVLGDLESPYLAYAVLVAGAVSAFWGVLFALIQNDLKRLLAYSTVENVGLIMVGIGVCLLSRCAGLTEIGAIGLGAALFHSFGHGLFKALLFLGAGAVDAATHTLKLPQLGGLARSMPVTGASFLLGSAAVCSLPPLNGFAGKWFLYQSMMRTVWESGSLVDRGIALFVIGVLGIVGGLALACFTKAFGITFLGNPRSQSAGQAHEASRGMLGAQIFLALSCVALGLLVPKALSFIEPVADQAMHCATNLHHAFVIPEGLIAITLCILVGLIYTVALRHQHVRRYITWECGFGALSAKTQASSDSFAQPVARIFSPLLRYQVSFEIKGKDRRHFPEQIKVKANMLSLLEYKIYRPALALIDQFARAIAKLQAGSIHLYLVYLCCTLVVLLLLGTRM
jgi:hydrogenase-4 component B